MLLARKSNIRVDVSNPADNDTEQFKQLVEQWGADLVGVGDLSRGEEKATLSDELKHFTRVISVAIHCPVHNGANGANDADHANGATRREMLDYMGKNQAAVTRLNEILKKTVKELKQRKARYFAFPPVHNADSRRFSSVLFHLFPHRTGATCSGLGWIGKSGMLINAEYGPHLVWATILTNAELAPSAPLRESLCMECGICQALCPAGAVKGINWNRTMGNDEIVDLEACKAHMASNAPIFGRPVCATCLMACPIGSKSKTLHCPVYSQGDR